MKHYVLIEVDTGHGVAADCLAEGAMDIIMGGVGSQLDGVGTIATCTTEELHTAACLLMDGLS